MCGIAGIVCRDGTPDLDALSAMQDQLFHRGPDDSDQYVDGRVALAHTRLSIIDLVGATTIGGLMATIESSSIVIANDSAALHMAVGFDRPLVGLFGPTRVDLVGPYGRESDVLAAQGPGDRNRHKEESWGTEAMSKLSLDEVFQAAHTRLARATPPASSGG